MSLITLATLSQATAQQVFDQVATHLLTQGARSQRTYGDYVYRNASGLKCAVGCLIADDEYSDGFEGLTWKALARDGRVPASHNDLIARLQDVHDRADPEDWLPALACLASYYALSPAALQPWIDAS